jgi:hypothetical protein
MSGYNRVEAYAAVYYRISLPVMCVCRRAEAYRSVCCSILPNCATGYGSMCAYASNHKRLAKRIGEETRDWVRGLARKLAIGPFSCAFIGGFRSVSALYILQSWAVALIPVFSLLRVMVAKKRFSFLYRCIKPFDIYALL